MKSQVYTYNIRKWHHQDQMLELFAPKSHLQISIYFGKVITDYLQSVGEGVIQSNYGEPIVYFLANPYSSEKCSIVHFRKNLDVGLIVNHSAFGAIKFL